jgi:hypothetical protein
VANVPLLLCGTVGTFTAATSAAAGSLTIGASTIPIATGATVTGLTTGQFACINATLNASGQLTAATVSTGATQFCGTVTAYTASTATTAGTLTIAGATFGIAAGTVFSPDILALNGNFCIQGTFNASGQLTGGTVTFAVPLAATPVYGTVDRKHQQLAQTLATQAV